MSVTKRISGDYHVINSDANLSGNVTFTTGTFFIQGNLLVGGNSTSITQTNTSISDNFLYLNAGESGNGVSSTYSGLEIDRGLAANVFLRWNETVKNWQITTNGIGYGNIATTSGSGSLLGNVNQDLTPGLGGNLDLHSHTLWDSTTTANVQIFLSNTVNSGGTGVYVTNTKYTNTELMSKTRSVAYSILFG